LTFCADICDNKYQKFLSKHIHLAPVNQLKKRLTYKKLFNGLFLIGIAIILLNPAAKAFTLRALMGVGLFRPSVNEIKPDLVPDAGFTDNYGRTVQLSSLKGKVVFINFWATWCPPCLAELPAINTIYQKQGKDTRVVFLTVDVGNNLNSSVAFMAKHGYTLPVYAAASVLPDKLVGNTIPTTIILNKKGQIVFKHEGVANYDDTGFAAYLDHLITEK
jgi:thiol-disulfide isomerase/thioredoxin